MKNDAVTNATGRTEEYWFALLDSENMMESPHPDIASRLAREKGISQWWSQELTVRYERRIGRRVEGQTADGRFQIGVTRSFRAPASALWKLLNSSEGIELLCGEWSNPDALALGDHSGEELLANLRQDAPSGIRAETTTFQSGSHVRMRWQPPSWNEHSILQIRITEKGSEGCSVTFHHEKLPDAASRDHLKKRWKSAGEYLARRMSSE